MNTRTLADPPREEHFELPFGVDLGDSSPGYDLAANYQPDLIGADIALAKADGEDYIIQTPYGKARLQRDIDFGVIPNTKQPTLLKAGAEKVAMSYGLLQHYTIENMHQDFDGEAPLMFYLVKCELFKIPKMRTGSENGKEYVFTTGYGSANTREKRNGRSDAYNSANSCIKMAQKRALTAAALSISGLSSMFTQDMDNEDFINSNIAALSATNNPDAPITRKQMNLLYAKAGDRGMTTAQAKAALTKAGFPSVRGLTQKDYPRALELFESPAEKETKEAMKGEA